MPSGLFCVLSAPSDQLSVQDYHRWYDEVHVPMRLKFQDFAAISRYNGASDWLAVYETIDDTIFDRPEYKALRDHRPPGEQEIIDRLTRLDRRFYRNVASCGSWSFESDFDFWECDADMDESAVAGLVSGAMGSNVTWRLLALSWASDGGKGEIVGSYAVFALRSDVLDTLVDQWKDLPGVSVPRVLHYQIRKRFK